MKISKLARLVASVLVATVLSIRKTNSVSCAQNTIDPVQNF